MISDGLLFFPGDVERGGGERYILPLREGTDDGGEPALALVGTQAQQPEQKRKSLDLEQYGTAAGGGGCVPVGPTLISTPCPVFPRASVPLTSVPM